MIGAPIDEAIVLGPGEWHVTGGCNVRTVRVHVGPGRMQVTTADGGICREWQRGEPRQGAARGARE